MKEIKKVNGLIISSVVYFFLFFLIPLVLSWVDIFTKDFMWQPWYMLVVFTPLSIIFIVVVLKIFGFNKKRLFSLIGLILFTYLISVIYVFVRVGEAVSNPKFMSW